MTIATTCHICKAKFPHPHGMFCSAAWPPINVVANDEERCWEYQDPNDARTWHKISDTDLAFIISAGWIGGSRPVYFMENHW